MKQLKCKIEIIDDENNINIKENSSIDYNNLDFSYAMGEIVSNIIMKIMDHKEANDLNTEITNCENNYYQLRDILKNKHFDELYIGDKIIDRHLYKNGRNNGSNRIWYVINKVDNTITLFPNFNLDLIADCDAYNSMRNIGYSYSYWFSNGRVTKYIKNSIQVRKIQNSIPVTMLNRVLNFISPKELAYNGQFWVTNDTINNIHPLRDSNIELFTSKGLIKITNTNELVYGYRPVIEIRSDI